MGWWGVGPAPTPPLTHTQDTTCVMYVRVCCALTDTDRTLPIWASAVPENGPQTNDSSPPGTVRVRVPGTGPGGGPKF